jgi:hypothetical protein
VEILPFVFVREADDNPKCYHTSQEKTMIKAAGLISHSSFDASTRICFTVYILIITMLLVVIYPVRFISFHETGSNEKVLVFNIKTHPSAIIRYLELD